MLKIFGIKGDIIYIDVVYDFENVYLDFVKYWDLLIEDGVLIGDDFVFGWLGFQRGVEYFCLECKFKFIVEKFKYIICGKNDVESYKNDFEFFQQQLYMKSNLIF